MLSIMLQIIDENYRIFFASLKLQRFWFNEFK